jgi:predicted secreted protein
MAVYSTSTFAITVGGSTLTGLVDASFDFNMETVDVTEIGAVERSHVRGVSNATGSGNLFYDQSTAAIAALESAVRSGSTVAVVFTNHSGATYSGNAIITKFGTSAAVNDVVKASFSMQFTGAITIA